MMKLAELRTVVRPKVLRSDGMAGLVLGVESVPDGLASGLLAGVNPVAGLYAYMVGAFSAAFFTSTAFMAVQGTGAMAIIVADVGLDSIGDDPARALFTLSIVTGVVMVVAGLLKLGVMLRFVPNSVMVGFLSAVGINIVLGQLPDFTGYAAEGSNRVARTFDLLVHFWRVDVWTLTVGVVTIVLIVVLRRTRLGALGMVVAIVLGSLLAALFGVFDKTVQLVGDIADVPGSLPLPMLPSLSDVPALLIPALSLAFVGLVQGAGVTSAFPNRDGSPSDASQDFVGQGVGNVASGFFQGMPVGGSMSASSLVVSAGARSRLALIYTGVVMAVVIVLFGGAVEHIAMPALAGLLIVVGVETIKPAEIVNVYRTGRIQAGTMVVTLLLTLLIPLQYAVLVGVGISMLLYVFRQSEQVFIKQLIFEGDDRTRVRRADPPDVVGPKEVVVLQPFGSLFYAGAPVFEAELPEVTEQSVGSVVIIRLEGKVDVGSTLITVLEDYARSLQEVRSKLAIVTDSDRVTHQLDTTGAADVIGRQNIRLQTEYVYEATMQLVTDSRQWVEDRKQSGDET